MKISKPFEKAFTYDYYIADFFGGRGGMRSHHLALKILYNLLYNEHFTGFLTRAYHASIYGSAWKDLIKVKDLFEAEHGSLNGILSFTNSKQGENQAVNLITGASLTTKGFKTSSGEDTGKMKSLSEATHLFIEEADEVDEMDFIKAQQSLRKAGVSIQITRAFNPPPANHWIWKDDYDLVKVTHDDLLKMAIRVSDNKNEEIEACVSASSRTYYNPKLKENDIKHICVHTNYFDSYQYMNEMAIKLNDKLMKKDFHKYCTQVLGLIPNEDGDVVYLDFKKDLNHTNAVVEKGEALHIGMDFNSANMAAVVHVVRGDLKLAVNEFSKVYDTHTMCRMIKERYPDNKITVYPDASGQNKKSNGLSDFDIIKNFGFTIVAPKANGAVRDRINLMNSEFRNLKYFVNTYACPDYVECLTKQKYDKGEPDKKKGFDHMNDAAGYFIVNSNIKKTTVYKYANK